MYKRVANPPKWMEAKFVELLIGPPHPLHAIVETKKPLGVQYCFPKWIFVENMMGLMPFRACERDLT